MKLTAPEMVVWWWLFFAGVLPGLWSVLRRRSAEVLPILALVLTLVVIQSLAFGNTGYVFRQRVHLLPWLLMFAAVRLENRRPRPSWVDGSRLAGPRFPAIAGGDSGGTPWRFGPAGMGSQDDATWAIQPTLPAATGVEAATARQ